jgi:uncharacterized protein (DUF486 family)
MLLDDVFSGSGGRRCFSRPARLGRAGIAFFEYCLQVPTNRIGARQFAVVELKVIQEVITLVVFAFFSVLYLKEGLRWNHGVSFLLLLGAVFFAFRKW